MGNMNPFLAIAGVLNLGAAFWYLSQGDVALAIAWFGYTIGTGAMSFVK